MRIFQRLISFMIAFSCVYVHAHAATLVFDKYIEIRNERILLGDIAQIQDAGKDKLALSAIDLGKAPAIGRLEKLETVQVLRWINHRYPQFQNVNIEGATTLLIKTATRVIPVEDLKEKAEDALSSTFVNAAQWEILSLPRPSEFIVPDRDYQLIVSSIQPTKQCERVMVKIDAVYEGDLFASKVLWFKKATLDKGAETFARQQGSENLKPDSLGHCENLCDCRWQVENQTLIPKSFKQASDVTRLEEVVIEMRNTSFVIETKGIALANAKKGEKVQVKRMGSKDSFIATVTESGRVQVVEGVRQ